MARTKRRISNKELRELQKIENLLNNHQNELGQQYKQTDQLKVEMKTEPLPFSDTYMSEHAFEKSEERFGIKRNDAQNYFRKKLREAKLIGLQQSESGNETYLYAIGRNAMYLSPDLKTIVSVNRYETLTYEPLKDKVAELHEREIRKLSRKERTLSKQLEFERVKGKAEIGQLELRMFKSKSESVRMSCAARKKAIELYINELEEELNLVQKNKRRVCRSMVAVV